MGACVLQAMLAEFARQIDEEKRAKEAESKAKAAAYQEMLKGNAKELERKKAIKQAEIAENHRLFELQIEMAEKQVINSCRFVLCMKEKMPGSKKICWFSCPFL